jgi:hypothetical protein
MCKKHGVSDKLNCLICNPNGPPNKCICNNNGTCQLCQFYKPLCNDINRLCQKILSTTEDIDSCFKTKLSVVDD